MGRWMTCASRPTSVSKPLLPMRGTNSPHLNRHTPHAMSSHIGGARASFIQSRSVETQRGHGQPIDRDGPERQWLTMRSSAGDRRKTSSQSAPVRLCRRCQLSSSCKNHPTLTVPLEHNHGRKNSSPPLADAGNRWDSETYRLASALSSLGIHGHTSRLV